MFLLTKTTASSADCLQGGTPALSETPELIAATNLPGHNDGQQTNECG
jgi:hypothetical protein